MRYSTRSNAIQSIRICWPCFFPRVHSPIAASGALETLIKAAKSRKGSKRQTWNNKTQPELELPCIWVLIISSPRCEMAGVAQCPRATPLVAPQNNCSTGLVWQCQRAQCAMVPEPYLSGLNFMAESMPQDVSISLECTCCETRLQWWHNTTKLQNITKSSVDWWIWVKCFQMQRLHDN